MKSVKKEVSFRRKLMTAVLSVTLPLIALLLFSNLYSTRAFKGVSCKLYAHYAVENGAAGIR